MNIDLLETHFGQSYPEEPDGVLDSISLAVTCNFNRRGSLLAVGCNDGRIVVWDFLTRGIAKIIPAHVHPVSSLCFSRRGNYIVSASSDNTVCIFDVLSSDCIRKWRFPTPVLRVQFHPRNENLILVCPFRHAAVLIHSNLTGSLSVSEKETSQTNASSRGITSETKNNNSGSNVIIEENSTKTTDSMDIEKIDDNTNGSANVDSAVNTGNVSAVKEEPSDRSTSSPREQQQQQSNDCPNKTHTILPLDEDSDLNITASFDRKGQYVYAGNAKGRIVVIKLSEDNSPTTLLSTPTIIASFRVSNTAIKQIEFAPKRKDIFLVNTADRIIRVYQTEEIKTCGVNGEPEPIQKLQDQVNKSTWKKCCFSGGLDAEYICAGSSRQHKLYIWERSTGSLVKILEGTKGEMLLDVVWHPSRPICASISSGVVFVWAQSQVENWSAFAPSFKELDENVEYEERESEFDLEDEDRSPARIAAECKEKEEENDVDVTSINPAADYLSSDESEAEAEKELLYLPVTLEIEEPECAEVLPITITPATGAGATKASVASVGKGGAKPIDIALDAPKDDSALPVKVGPGRPAQQFGVSSVGSSGIRGSRVGPGKRSSSSAEANASTGGKRKKKGLGYSYDDY